MSNNLSLFIPRVFINFTANDIGAVFEQLRIGKVRRVDLVLKVGKDRKKYNSAYIHFQHWYDNTAANNFCKRVLNPKTEARIVYDDPWYWIVLPNTVSPVSLEKPKLVSHHNYEVIKPASHVEIIPQHEEDDEEEFLEQLEREFDDVEAAMNDDDRYLVTIDSRYVQALEKEIDNLRMYFQGAGAAAW